MNYRDIGAILQARRDGNYKQLTKEQRTVSLNSVHLFFHSGCRVLGAGGSNEYIESYGTKVQLKELLELSEANHKREGHPSGPYDNREGALKPEEFRTYNVLEVWVVGSPPVVDKEEYEGLRINMNVMGKTRT